jgi:hypothetical protein
VVGADVLFGRATMTRKILAAGFRHRNLKRAHDDGVAGGLLQKRK